MVHSIIVGGTKGLGRVVSRQLAKRGDVVTLLGRSDISPEDLTAGDIKSYKCDITKTDKLFKTLEEIISSRGKINYCVFLQRYRGEEDNWYGEYQTTLTATKQIVDYITPHFSQQGDKCLVMVSSVYSKYVGDGQLASYHVAKAGLDQLMRYYAFNLGPQCIRANAITPFTYLKEESQTFYLNNLPLLELYKTIIPLKRMATAEDSANIVNFLCSEKSSFITGQNIVIDGGLSLVWPETLARRLSTL